MSEATQIDTPTPPPAAPAAEKRIPTVIVEDLHVTYKVYASGKRAKTESRLRKRGMNSRQLREVHALRGVSFTAYEGEAIGVIGSNGSGKSTMLRAIAGLTPATQGAVWAETDPTLLGVNAALINDLSGERNIMLGGLALGMEPDEVRDKYDSIKEFADIGDSIELPMRTYSSGMAARVRFAIAASVSHRVLMIDEALAVGDADFQRRSEERIRELRTQAGTVFLVSHSLNSITSTCERALWIEKGQLRLDGTAQDVVKAYKAFTR